MSVVLLTISTVCSSSLGHRREEHQEGQLFINSTLLSEASSSSSQKLHQNTSHLSVQKLQT
jgi:hypothetical protein